MAGRTVTYTFIADVDNFEQGVKRAKTSAQDLFTAIGKDAERLVSGRKLAGAFKEIGQSMTTAFTLPIVGAFTAVTAASAGFDREMVKSMSIMGNVSTDTRKKLEDNARSVAKTLGVSHEEAAKSYYYLASAGLSVEQSMQAMRPAAEFAKAGFMDMNAATEILMDSQSALGLRFADSEKNAQAMTRVSDVITKASIVSNASIQQLGESLTTKAGAAMRTFNIDVEQGAAVLAAYADQGVKGRIAGERFDILLRELTTQARENSAAFKEAKISVFDSTGGLRNLGEIIGDVEHRFKGMSTEQKIAQLSTLGFRAEANSAILALVGMSGKIRDTESALRSAGGATKEVAEKNLKSFSEQANLLKIAVVDVAISLGEKFLPIAQRVVTLAKNDLVPAVSALVDKFKALPTGVQDATLVVVGFLAVLGPGVYVIGATASAISSVIGAAKTLMATNMATTIAGWVGTLAGGQGLIGVLGAAGGALSGFLSVAVPWGVAAGAVFVGVYKTVKMLIDAIPGLRPAIDMEMANVYRWATGTKGNRELENPTAATNPLLGEATKNFLKTGKTDAVAVTTAANEASSAVKNLGAAIGEPPKKSFIKDYLEELRQVPKTANEIARAVRESIEEGLSRAGYAPLIATALGGVTTVTGSAGKAPGWDLPTAAPGWYGGSDYKPGIATTISTANLNNSLFKDNGASVKAAAGADVLSRNLQNLSNVFNLASNATGKLGSAARSLASIAGGGAGISSGLGSLFGTGGQTKTDFGTGFTGLLGKAGAIGSVAASALSIGSAIWGMFKGKPKEPPPPPPKQVDPETWMKFQTEQMSKGTSGLSAGVAGIQLTNSGDLTSQATIAGLQFWSIFKTQGLTAAAGATKDVIGKLVENLAQFGSEAAAAVLAPVQQQIALAENDAFKGASEGAKGFADVLAGQVNARMPMTIEQFGAFGQQAVAAFEQAKAGAIATGLSTEEATRAALQAVGPLVTTAVDAAGVYGFAIDANTQSLLEQAKANNVAFATNQTDRLIMSVDALTKALGGVPPAVGAIAGAMNSLPTEHTFNIRINQDGGIRLPGDVSVEPGNSFAFGTGGLRDFGAGTMAMLHNREAVLTETEFRALTRAAGGGGSGSSGPAGMSVTFGDLHINASDAAGGRAAARAFRDELENAIVSNAGGMQDMLRQRLKGI